MIKVGSRVAYSVQFLKNIGMSHSDMSRGRGTVEAIKDLGGLRIATVNWDAGHDLPGIVNVSNLAEVGPNTGFASC